MLHGGREGCSLYTQQEQEQGQVLTVGACTVRTCTLRRLHRVREVPVMEVTVTYPVLEAMACFPAPEGRADGEPDEEDVRRFNEGCRAVGEAFVAWAMDGPAAGAETAYLAAGAEAANRYRFVRRELSCRMTLCTPPYDGMPPRWDRVIRKAEADGQVAFCLVREVRMGLRHREGGTCERTASLWLYPALSPESL